MAEHVVLNSPVVRNTIISELLCYLQCKFGKIPLNSLKLVISDFYKSSDISTAKELLTESVDNLNIDKWVKAKPARRKNSDNKCRNELEDIFSVLCFLDENLQLDKLPIFVAQNVDNLPSNRIEEGDLRCVLNKLDILDKKLDNPIANQVQSNVGPMINVNYEMFDKLNANIEKVEKALANELDFLKRSRNKPR